MATLCAVSSKSLNLAYFPVKGTKTTVVVEGLNKAGTVRAETGDNVRLTCTAKGK